MFIFLKTLPPGGIQTHDLLQWRRQRPLHHAVMAGLHLINILVKKVLGKNFIVKVWTNV
jgi:hypothetical protein